MTSLIHRRTVLQAVAFACAVALFIHYLAK